MLNLSIENFCIVKKTLKPEQLTFNNVTYNYFETIHIENRDDLDCEKTIILMQNSILYNFFNEFLDSEYFLNNCNHTENLRKALIKYNCYNNNNNRASKRTFVFNMSVLTFICFIFMILMIYI